MPHQVSLRTEAYEALKQVKDPNESFSDLVLRLLREHRASRKDPWIFVRGQRMDPGDLDERLAEVERWRDEDRVPEDF